jgi:hypothetical protein
MLQFRIKWLRCAAVMPRFAQRGRLPLRERGAHTLPHRIGIRRGSNRLRSDLGARLARHDSSRGLPTVCKGRFGGGEPHAGACS